PPAALARMGEIHALASGNPPDGEQAEDWDRGFHAVIWRAAGVDQLSDMIQTLWDLGAYYRTLINRGEGVTRSRAIEHGALLAAFQSGSLENAVESIRRHRLQALERLLSYFAEMNNEPDATRAGLRAETTVRRVT